MLRVGLIQSNGSIGDFDTSLQHLTRAYEAAVVDGAAVVFADISAFTGHPLFAMGVHRAFLDAQNKALDTLAQLFLRRSIPLIIKAVRHDPNGEDSDFDSVIIADGSWQWFPHPFFSIQGVRVYTSSQQLLAHHDLSAPSLYVLSDGDPFTIDDNPHRSLTFFQNNAKRMGCAIVHLCRVGGQDCYVYSGGSVVINASGELIARLPFHGEATAVIDLNAPPVEDTVPPAGDLGFLYDHLVHGLRDYVHKNGFKGLVLGLSGGVDSALSASIAVDALGADKVLGVLLPSVHTSDLSRRLALESCTLLGIKHLELPIVPAAAVVEDTLATMVRSLDSSSYLSVVSVDNIQARIRGLYLMGLSNQLGYILLATGNKSEVAVGYATLYGDMCGGFNVLADLYKTEVWSLATYRNGLGAVIPHESITRAPTAELHANQQDSDTLPPYPILDPIVRRFVEDGASPDQIIADFSVDSDVVYHVWRLLMQSQYKREQACLSLVVRRHSFVHSWHFPITHQLLRKRGLS